jgi:HD-GYP domain-containing protein (c-di-GMP phosphodiesterase class II)
MAVIENEAALRASGSRTLPYDGGPDEASGRHRSALGAGLAHGDRIAVSVLGGGFLAATALLLALVPEQRQPGILTIALFVAVYALVSRIEFEVFGGTTVPTQLVLVPMLFVLPLRIVPLAVAAGLMLGAAVDWAKGRIALERVTLSLIGSWHVVGPVLVFWAADVQTLEWSHWPIYVAALAVQFGFELAAVSAHEWLARRTRPAELLPHIGRAQLIDATLAPIGLAVAFAAQSRPATVLLLFPLVALLRVFASERRAAGEEARALSVAYRGTACLLRDLVEADHAYTGLHTRDVVELSVAVADELGLSPAERRDTELAALLNDVGKTRIPAEIISKPGKLTPDEWAVMETHTLEAEKMLERHGGLLGDVARIVRSCHERWDGTGYPDGLAGEAIPRVARIVMCCDAFSAMTTDRPYRKALPLETALGVLRANAGTQFDPVVAGAVIAVASRDLPGPPVA